MSGPVKVVDVELTPIARQAGVAYIHDVELDADVWLAVGDSVQLRDEGGVLWEATVAVVEPVRFGRRYRLTISPAVARNANGRGMRQEP